MKPSKILLTLTLLTLPFNSGYAIDKGETINLMETAKWFGTGADNSLVKDKSIFKFKSKSFKTNNTEINIHAHKANIKTSPGQQISYTGKFKILESNGGVGVTFLSDYPKSDSYYRLREFNGGTVHLAPHGTFMDEGVEGCDTGVTLEAGFDYNFQVIFKATAQKTNIKARVWKVGEPKPAIQVNCNDTSETRLKSGKFGIWAMADGAKIWKRLKAKRLK